jgi:hypothetical protein
MLGDVRFGGWSRNVETWNERTAPTVVVRYEDLVERPADALRAAAAAVGLSTGGPAADMPSFESLRVRWPGMFRRGVSGAWVDEMPEPLHQEFWRRHGSGMRLLGYT